MFFIFGWGRQTVKEFDPNVRHHCAHCQNDVDLILYTLTKWFTLFFIPIIPYESSNYLSCPICSYGRELTSVQANEIREGNLTSVMGLVQSQSPQLPSEARPDSDSDIMANVDCPHCQAEVGLSRSEYLSRAFTCPACGKSSELNVSAR